MTQTRGYGILSILMRTHPACAALNKLPPTVAHVQNEQINFMGLIYQDRRHFSITLKIYGCPAAYSK